MLLSDCYGGRATDQYICASSNLYSHLVPGDDVMADWGFQIEEDLLHYHCTLNVPPGARAKSQNAKRPKQLQIYESMWNEQ